MAFTAINKCFQSKTWLLGRVSKLATPTPGERRMTGRRTAWQATRCENSRKGWRCRELSRLIDLELEMALDEFAKFLAVFVFHVYKFDAVPSSADISDYRGEVDFAEAGANLQLDRIADVELLWRFEIGAAETDRFDTRESGLRSVNLRAQRRFERNAGIATWHDEASIRVAAA